MARGLLLRLGAALLLGCAAAAFCPPPGFTTVDGLNVTRYLGSWYVQQQEPTSYTPANSLYCVKAEYALAFYRFPGTDLGVEELVIFNQAKVGGVDGFQRNSGGLLLAGVPIDAERGRFLVGIPGAPRRKFGPYWVVAVSPTPAPDPYEWAIITGGPPTVHGRDGLCHNPTMRKRSSVFAGGEGQGEGFWLFTRDQVAPAETVETIRDVALFLGLDVSVLRNVTQKHCRYKPFPIMFPQEPSAPAPAPAPAPTPSPSEDEFLED